MLIYSGFILRVHDIGHSATTFIHINRIFDIIAKGVDFDWW